MSVQNYVFAAISVVAMASAVLLGAVKSGALPAERFAAPDVRVVTATPTPTATVTPTPTPATVRLVVTSIEKDTWFSGSYSLGFDGGWLHFASRDWERMYPEYAKWQVPEDKEEKRNCRFEIDVILPSQIRVVPGTKEKS